VAIDTGKFETVGMTLEKIERVRTKVDESDGLAYSSGTYKVEYNGRLYVVGDGAETSNYDVSKMQLVHKVCTLTVLGLLGSIDVDLIVGCPLSQYINKEAREEFSLYFIGSHTITVDGKLKSINIRSVKVLPETIGVVALNEDFFKNKAVGVVDVGGLNTNACVYADLQPIKSTILTKNEGGNIITSKIVQNLISITGKNYQDWEIPYLYNSSNEDVRKIISNSLEGQLNKILDDLKARNWNVGQYPIVFTGGGSRLLKKQIEALPYASILSEDPELDNVKGYYDLREVI